MPFKAGCRTKQVRFKASSAVDVYMRKVCFDFHHLKNKFVFLVSTRDTLWNIFCILCDVMHVYTWRYTSVRI